MTIRGRVRRFFWRSLQLAFLLLLPFFTLLRAGVWLHADRGWSPWAALAGGFCLSGALLLIYGLVLQHRFTGRLPAWGAMRWQSALVLAFLSVYCVPALMSLSVSNAKSEAVRAEFRSLHPVLRLGVSTLIWVDPSLVLTDASRVPADYRGMGLPTHRRSLHYQQADGYVYAVDVRTRGRSGWRNALAAAYFRLLGFDCLRHGGTADHLHISLPERSP